MPLLIRSRQPLLRPRSAAAAHRLGPADQPTFWENALDIFGVVLFLASIVAWAALGGWLGFGIFMACLVVLAGIGLWQFGRGRLT